MSETAPSLWHPSHWDLWCDLGRTSILLLIKMVGSKLPWANKDRLFPDSEDIVAWLWHVLTKTSAMKVLQHHGDRLWNTASSCLSSINSSSKRKIHRWYFNIPVYFSLPNDYWPISWAQKEASLQIFWVRFPKEVLVRDRATGLKMSTRDLPIFGKQTHEPLVRRLANAELRSNVRSMKAVPHWEIQKVCSQRLGIQRFFTDFFSNFRALVPMSRHSSGR